jgi:sulfatase modifying factor 1
MNAARLLTIVALLLATTAHAAPIELDMVTVGDPGNAPDATGYGAVAETFQIGKYEVTIQQYTDFLNAVAKSDPYSLYIPMMGEDPPTAGISRAGVSGAYTYSVIGSGSRPVTFVSSWDAARFANWMHNGQGFGSTEIGGYWLNGETWVSLITEIGAYTLNGQTTGSWLPAVNAGAKFYIPTEDQWYKAAYYKGGGINAGYWAYATQSDTPPGNAIGNAANQANYYAGDYSSSHNRSTDVGAFTNSASYYGTFDQTGNVSEWNDQGLRGGGFGYDAIGVSSSFRTQGLGGDDDGIGIGFRLAAPVAVPEPSTWVMGLAGFACAALAARRRQAASGAAVGNGGQARKSAGGSR